MICKLILFVAILGVVLGRPQVRSNSFIHLGSHSARLGSHFLVRRGVHAVLHHGNSYHPDSHVPAHYAFDYGVHDDYSGNHFGHSESRDGYNTKGSYSVHLPDGRVQTVTYYADQSGYHPSVSYTGTAHHPAHHAPAYHVPATYH